MTTLWQEYCITVVWLLFIHSSSYVSQKYVLYIWKSTRARWRFKRSGGEDTFQNGMFNCITENRIELKITISFLTFFKDMNRSKIKKKRDENKAEWWKIEWKEKKGRVNKFYAKNLPYGQLILHPLHHQSQHMCTFSRIYSSTFEKCCLFLKSQKVTKLNKH